MLRKFLFISLLCLLICSLAPAQFNWFASSGIPDWVQHIQEGNSIDDALSYYFGIGVSTESQKEADNLAREEFAKSVEVNVISLYEENIKEHNASYSENIETSTLVLTDLSIKGISIQGRYFDKEKKMFYSLMKLRKEDYNRIFIDELEKEKERQIAIAQAELKKEYILLEKEKQSYKINEEAEIDRVQSELAKEKIALDKKKQSNLIKEEKERENIRHKKEKKRSKQERLRYYNSFLEMKPPDQVISFRNGELPSGTHDISINLGIVPVTFTQFHYGYRIRSFSISSTLIGWQNKIENQEFMLKLQIFPYSGSYYKISLSFGYIEYLHSLYAIEKWKSIKPETSPFIAFNLALPDLMHSYSSIYADARKYSLGLNSYPFFDNYGDRISFLIEMNYIRHEEFRNRFNEDLVFQEGLRFKTGGFMATFTYERNESLVFSIRLVF